MGVTGDEERKYCKYCEDMGNGKMHQSTPHICADCPKFDGQRLECLGFKRGLQGAVCAWMEERPLDLLRFIGKCEIFNKETNVELLESLEVVTPIIGTDSGVFNLSQAIGGIADNIVMTDDVKMVKMACQEAGFMNKLNVEREKLWDENDDETWYHWRQ